MAEKLAVGDTISMRDEVSIMQDDGRVTVWLHGLGVPVTVLPQRGGDHRLGAQEARKAAVRQAGLTISIDNIARLIDNHVRLTAWCNVCRHHDLLELDALGHPLGFYHSTMHSDLTPKLRYTACGSRDAGLIMRPQQGRRLSGSRIGQASGKRTQRPDRA